jgi:hypothetical protein
MKNIMTTKFSAVVVAVLLLTSFAVILPSINIESFTASADEVTVSSPGPFPQDITGDDDDLIASLIKKIGGTIMIKLADAADIAVVMGKNLTQGIIDEECIANEGSVGILAADNPVAAEDCISEFNPSIAAKPNNPNLLIAVAENLDLMTISPPEDISGDTVCRAYVSTDGGENWSAGTVLPVPVDTQCVHPVVRWAPADGTDSDKNIRVYAVYVALHDDLSTSDIVVSFSNNDGTTWSTPVVAIAGYSGNGEQTMLFDPWIATHINFPGAPGTGNVNDKVYVTATRMEVATGEPPDCTMDILFNKSTNGGMTFNGVQVLATAGPTDECDPTLGLSGPAGGKITSTFSNVLVCWYNSEDKDPLSDDDVNFLFEEFDIRCKRSANFGVSFNGEVTAVNNRTHELPFSKCPVNTDGVGVFELDWWKGMRPSIEITRNGNAHIVYAADPNGDSEDLAGECGDIYYARAVNKAYKKWTPTLLQPTLNDDGEGKAQGFPTITSKTVIGKIDAILVAAWVDSRHSVDIGCTVPDGPDEDEPAAPDEIETNCTYDIFYAYTDASWSDHANRRVTDVSSLSSILQVQEYIDSSAHKVLTTPGNAFLIWTDRSDQGDTANEDEDVYEDMVNLPP